MFLGRRRAHAVTVPSPQPAPDPTPVTPVPPTPPRPVALNLRRYAPGTPEQVALFEQAARLANLPTSWASDPAFVDLLRRESGGWVGRPNYEYKGRSRIADRGRWPSVWAELRAGRITAYSSATGLGQLTLSNVDTYYPGATKTQKRAGIGKALPEAIGMLRYIKSRHKTPALALRFHKKNNWY
jgi:hypothetical protein